MPAIEPIILPGTHEFKQLTAQEFDQFRKLAYEKFGLDLREGKEQLVSARLTKRMRALNIGTYKDYYRFVTDENNGDELVSMIDALTTNHTSFFREIGHFDFLRDFILPTIKDRASIEIWSAACSTGEEPYSIVFSLLNNLGPAALPKLRLLATDISTKVLGIAEKGIYAPEKFRDVKPEELRGYLLKGERDGHVRFMVRKEVRNAIRFERLNLMEPFTHGRTFPLIFCRNVMIYFDRPTQQHLVRRLADCLEPGGYLFIGHAESLNGLDVPLRYVKPAIYQKTGKPEPHGKGKNK